MLLCVGTFTRKRAMAAVQSIAKKPDIRRRQPSVTTAAVLVFFASVSFRDYASERICVSDLNGAVGQPTFPVHSERG